MVEKESKREERSGAVTIGVYSTVKYRFESGTGRFRHRNVQLNIGTGMHSWKKAQENGPNTHRHERHSTEMFSCSYTLGYRHNNRHKRSLIQRLEFTKKIERVHLSGKCKNSTSTQKMSKSYIVLYAFKYSIDTMR